MKIADPALIAFLNAMRPIGDAAFAMADCFTFTLSAGTLAGVADGQVLAYTNFDLPVALNGHVYAANSVLVDGLKYKSSMGISVDEQEISISADASMTVGGIPFLQAIQQGLLDGAEIQRDRAFFADPVGAIDPGKPLTPIGGILLFKGRVGEVTSVGRSQATVKVASDLTLLSVDMPRRLFQPSCLHVLYDSGCTLDRSLFTFPGAVLTGSSRTVILWGGATTSYAQGSIRFTSGSNTGVTMTIRAADTGALTLSAPLPNLPGVGDAFEAVFGCDHTSGTCQSKFSNLANFLGFPYVPPPQIVTGPLSTTASGGKG